MSQAFYPTDNKRWLVVVATEPVTRGSSCVLGYRQAWGVNYHQNVWHHPLLVLEPQQFVIIDRGGDGHNCDETELDTTVFIKLDG